MLEQVVLNKLGFRSTIVITISKILFLSSLFLLICLWSTELGGSSSVRASTEGSFKADGIAVDSFPVDIAVNPITNMLYVTNQFSNTVSVIDTADKDQIIETIVVGALPYGVDVDPLSNRIYVTNIESNTVSVIDGSTNKVVNEFAGVSTPAGIAVNPLKSLVYVSNIDNDNISIIDGITNKIVSNVTVGSAPFGIAVYNQNRNTDLIYVANTLSNTVSVLNYTIAAESQDFRIDLMKEIPAGISPVGVAIDREKAIVYVTSKGSNEVYALNATTGDLLQNIKVGQLPIGLAVNSKTDLVYVSNTRDDTVSVIDSTVLPLRLIKNITVNPNMNPSIDIPSPVPTIMRFPNVASFVAVNEENNMIYVSNTGSNTISQIDGTVNDLVLGILFTIEPENLGSISCNGKSYQNDDYIRLPNNMRITCEASAESISPFPSFGFLSVFPPTLFDHWLSDQSPPESNNHVTTFILKDPGTIRAYFEEIPDFFQLLAVGFAVLTGIGAALYSKREWINKRRYLGKYLKKIDAAYEISNRRKGEGLELLEGIKKMSRDLFIQNKLTESDYFEIDKKIEDYRNKISRTGD